MNYKQGIPPEPYSKKMQNDHIKHKTKSMAMCRNDIQRVKIVINDNIIEQVTDFEYLGYRISEYKSDLEDKLQTYNKINVAIQRPFGKRIKKQNKELTTLQLKQH